MEFFLSQPQPLVLAILIFFGFIILIINSRSEKNLNSNSTPKIPTQCHEKINEMEQVNSKRKTLTIKIVLLGMLVVGVLVLIFLDKGKNFISEKDINKSFVAFIPIWIAVWIPFIANKKKAEKSNNPLDKEALARRQKIILLVVLGLLLLFFLVGFLGLS